MRVISHPLIEAHLSHVEHLHHCQCRSESLEPINTHQLLQKDGGFFEAQLREQLAESSVAVTHGVCVEGFLHQFFAGHGHIRLQKGHQVHFQAFSGFNHPLLNLRVTTQFPKALTEEIPIIKRIAFGSTLIFLFQALGIPFTVHTISHSRETFSRQFLGMN